MQVFSRTLPLLLLLLSLAACGNPHALAGNWAQELPSGAEGISLQFDDKGEKLLVHGAPRPDGGHSHPKVTHTWDDATKTLTLKGEVVDGSKADTWTGKLDGDRLELSSAEGKLAFRRGGKPHGH